jgi:hypothetical protein
MTRSEAYRDYAADCLALAVRRPEGVDRQHLIEMAVRWYELAQLLSSFGKENDGQEPSLDWPKR